MIKNISVFVRQRGCNRAFFNSDSWVILSEIEQRIKEKIERIGTPLKDWNIQINYGVKTGFNEAFIIDAVKRNELIAQDPKSDEIIRPILRGRDIKRYRYDFAECYLIATFPSRDYNIDDYPALKTFLEGFKPKLRQTGEMLTQSEIEQVMAHAKANSIPLKLTDLKHSRKKTNNKWFETQDSISYWDDFSKQKIVWGNLNLKASYAIAPEGYFVNAPCPMIVPADKFLLAVLNSKLADYYIRNLGVTRNGGYFEYKPMFIEQMPIPIISEIQKNKIANFIGESNDPKSEQIIESAIFELYDLTIEEANFIQSL